MLDLIMIILFLRGFLVGKKRGLIKQLMRFVSSIAALVIAYLFSSSVSDMIRTIIPLPNLNNLLRNLVEDTYYYIIAFVLLFIVVKIIVYLLGSVLSSIVQVPVIKQVNAIAGGVFGFVEVYVILFVILFIASYIPAEVITSQLNTSFLAKLMLDYTPFISQSLTF